MELDFAKLAHLLVIARLGNFTRAGEELGISQPALSRSVATIERRIGFKIFDRGRAGAAPTHLGGLVLKEIEQLMRRARTLERNLRLYGRSDAGRISFGMGPLVASVCLPKLSVDMLAAHPNLQLHCSIDSPELLLEKLLNEDIEIAFCMSDPFSSSEEIETVGIGSLPIIAVARDGHAILNLQDLDFSTLKSYQFLTSSEKIIADSAYGYGAMTCNNYNILHEITANSDAICMTVPDLISDYLSSGRLREVRLAGRPFGDSSIGLMRIKGRTNSPAATRIEVQVRAMLAKLRLNEPG